MKYIISTEILKSKRRKCNCNIISLLVTKITSKLTHPHTHIAIIFKFYLTLQWTRKSFWNVTFLLNHLSTLISISGIIHKKKIIFRILQRSYGTHKRFGLQEFGKFIKKFEETERIIDEMRWDLCIIELTILTVRETAANKPNLSIPLHFQLV